MLTKLIILLICFISISNCQTTNFIDKQSKIKQFSESQWFINNIPFIEIPDKNIEDVYYYRWSSHKRHLRYTTLGSGYQVTEFVNNIGYEGKFGVINAAAGHHIYESRWLRNQKYVKDFINFWSRQMGSFGSATRYSEWIADAVWASFLVDGDKEFIKSQLYGLVNWFNKWKSNFEPKLGLYYITPVDDAQEYSAASVQTKDKFGGGLGYRPSFNSELYGNTIAIQKIAQLVNDTRIYNQFKQIATDLRKSIIKHLWDDKRKFFYHLQRENNPNNILLDTMEEVGFYPWRFHVPDNQYNYSVAWDYLFDQKIFDSNYGPATCDMRSKWYDGNQTHQCCWWNGNSWPYSTAHTLKSLAEQIKFYNKTANYNSEHYYSMLKKYAMTHYKNDVPYVAECHSPEGNFWVCDSTNRSEHYAHSTYTDNVISDLLGITPLQTNEIQINPLIPKSWEYFVIENLNYHGFNLTVLWDLNGSKYKAGSGLRVFLNGTLVFSQNNLSTTVIPIPDAVVEEQSYKRIENYAANVKHSGFPLPRASFVDPYSSTWQAVDGRIFYDSVPSNRWSNYLSPNETDWFSIDFGRQKSFNSVSLYIYSDVPPHGNGKVDCPVKIQIEYLDSQNKWMPANNQILIPTKCSPNDLNTIKFDSVKTKSLRINLTRNKANGYYIGITEIEIWSEWPQHSEPNTYEAEDAVLTNANLLESSSASGGAYVGHIDQSNSNVEFSGVYSPINGYVDVNIYYANAMKSSIHELTVNNLINIKVEYPPTSNGWGHFDDQNYVTVTVPLLKGNNILSFNHNSNFAELDKIKLVL